MAKQTILLGGVVKSEVEKINSNFTELYTAEESGNKSNDLSDYNNDSGFITSVDIANKVDKVVGKDLSSNDYTTSDKNKVGRLGKIDFTSSDFGQIQSDGYVYATISANGKYPVKVFKSNGGTYEEVLAQVNATNDNIVICSCSAFSGYVVTV